MQLPQCVIAGTGVQITLVGHLYLGAALPSISFMHINDSTQQHVSEWIAGVSCLSSSANNQPHALYFAFTHGCVSKWRTTIFIPIHVEVSGERVAEVLRKPLQ